MKNLRIAIYSRKSVYTGKGESTENQIEMCKQYIFAKINGVQSEEIFIYEDEGFSAKNLDRPQFKQMMEDLSKHSFGYVVCYRLDRISRNVSDFAGLIEDLNRQGITFICIKEEFDTSKPMGKAMMYIASVFAQLERETIAERVRDNMRMLARTGRWLGGTTPTGFGSEKVTELLIDGKFHTACKLKQEPGEIAVVQTIFEQYAKLESVSGVSKYLITNGIRSRTGKMFSLIGIKEILQNPVYCFADGDAFHYFTKKNADVCFEEKDCSHQFGLLSYNKRDYKKKNAPRQPMERWIIAIGKHKGIIPGKQWVEVQKALTAHGPKEIRPAKAHNAYALLSGQIFCKNCGSRYFAKTRCGNTHSFDYICQNKLLGGSKICNAPNLNGEKTDAMVFSSLLQYARTNSDLLPLLKKAKQNLWTQEKQESLPIAMDIQLIKCRKEIDNLLQTLADGAGDPSFVQHVKEKISQLDNKMQQLNEEKARTINGVQTETPPDAVALSRPLDVFSESTIPEKRTLLRCLVKRIDWDGKDLHIYPNN